MPAEKAPALAVAEAYAGKDRIDFKKLKQQEKRPIIALVLGSEGAGPGALVRKLCDAAVTLDMAGGKTGVDSYNVSVAAGILMYNIMQRRK